MATGGLISLIQSLPIIGAGIAGSFSSLGKKSGEFDAKSTGTKHTECDLPIWLVVLGCLGLVAAIAATDLIPTTIEGRVVGGVLIVVLGFLFVTVSSRLTGEIGSSSNPISGMTVAALLLTCLVFFLLGWIGPEYRLAALSIAGIVCVASSNGGTTSQDLKTGYLVARRPGSSKSDSGRSPRLGDRHRDHPASRSTRPAPVYSTKAENLPKIPHAG